MANKYNVIWSKVAEEDLTSIIKYIHSTSPSAAKKQLTKIKYKVSDLNSLPLRGRIVPELEENGILQYRELIISPWRIIYRVSDSNVYVLSVIDSRRNIEDILLFRLVRKK
ncbi:Death on curing protein, Doc toxin [hydrothermal vent metagenome]|uniref:Death on curing protein, Doc toxin n=1 Tax=hydrothermal vent metagenome TaxID=652676 RepID=A0A3B0YXV5_9ZZZZ